MARRYHNPINKQQLRRDLPEEDGFALLDGELRYMMVNQAMAAINGLPIADHIGRTVAEVLPTLAATIEPLLDQVLRTGEPVIDVEVRGALTPGGPLQRWLASYYPVRSRGGPIVAIDAIVHVLSERAGHDHEDISIAAQRERERFAASVIDASPYLIYISDLPSGRKRYVNRRIESTYGYSPAEQEAMGPGFLFKLLHPDDIPGVLAQVERLRAADDGEVIEHEHRFRHKNGSWRWLCCYELVFERDDHGAVTQVLGMAVDITARKEAELALQASEQRWLLALRAAGMVAWESDLVTNVVTWSPGAEEFFGFPPGAFGMFRGDVLSLVHPDDHGPVFAATEQALQHGLYTVDYRLIRADGALIWVRDQGETIYDGQGAPVRILGVAQDITALKQIQEDLRVSEERFRVALQGSPVIVFNQDRDLRYTWIHNPARGFSLELVVGSTDHALVDRPEDAEHLNHLKRRVIAEGAGRREEVRVLIEGEVHYYDLTLEPLRSAQGEVIGVTGASINITAQKRDEAERMELLEREREARQASEAALARAEAATRERDLLISIAAHDLRTPLTVVLGQAQLLHRRALKTGLDERNQRAIAMIADSAGRLNQMIGAFLDLSRIQEGRLVIQSEPLDLGALLRRVVGAVQSTVTVHRIVLQPPARPLMLQADPLRIEQVFFNLLGNAVKYSPNGGMIEIWTEAEAGWARVHIRDQGIGIPAEALPKLFTRFYRASNAIMQATSSMGVGLFIVQELVHAHGGSVAVTSAVNTGSTFTVSLPL